VRVLTRILAAAATSMVISGLLMSPPADAQEAIAAPASTYAERVLELTNQERARRGLDALRYDRCLEQAALSHDGAMAEQNFFSHVNPYTGSVPDRRVAETGYRWRAVGENIAAGFSTPEQVVADWMASDGHRRNILHPNYQELGVGYVLEAGDTFPGRRVGYRHYWTQVFGTKAAPTAACP
jgi:uncharacterized protein YkwD